MKIALLISGGVDSSVALSLLKEQGHEVTAFYLKIWLEDELSYLGSCPWQEDVQFAQAVCDHLGVPLEIVSLQQEYWDRVVSYTIEQVQLGNTPNPDIFCNKLIKFGVFLDYLERQGYQFDKIATGHYAQIHHEDGIAHLHRAKDMVKDQTYFLSYLTQQQLSRLIFPIGHLYKSQVRELAARYTLPNHLRKDSQGICFLGKLKFADFIHHYLGERQGNLIEYETGNIIGTHKGYWYYTYGQRQGLGLAGGPWYVVGKNKTTNEVYISNHYYDADKTRNSFTVQACNWISDAPTAHNDVMVKIRHGAHQYFGSIKKISDDAWKIVLHEDDQGLAPGQFAVIYQEDRCLGAGIITPHQT